MKLKKAISLEEISMKKIILSSVLFLFCLSILYSQGANLRPMTVDDALNKIRSATTTDQVRQIYNAYPLLQKEIKSQCIARNKEIDNPVVSEVINPKPDNHGTG